jgi:hypothetical protein
MGLVVAISLMAVTAASPVNAAPPLPAGCDKVRGTIECTQTETVGNAPENSNAQRTTTTTDQKGSFESSHEPVTECTGPPGQCR